MEETIEERIDRDKKEIENIIKGFDEITSRLNKTNEELEQMLKDMSVK